MAEMTDCELIEVELRPDVDLRRFLSCATTGSPPVDFTAVASEPVLSDLAQKHNATAILTGEIGDDMLGHSPAPGMLAEALASLGWSSGFVRAAFDYALLTRLSVWRAISQSIKFRRWLRATSYWSYFRYKRFRGLDEQTSLAAADAIRQYESTDLARYIHPWLANAICIPFGRIMLLWSLVQVTSTWFHSPFAGSVGDLFITPLASQPMVEAFCEIPSHLHFIGGENGAVARRAFGSRLSREVITRGTGKGTPDVWIRDLIPNNRRFLQELLIDGILVKQQILDKCKLEAVLSGSVDRCRISSGELLMQLYTECWLRNWADICARAAA